MTVYYEAGWKKSVTMTPKNSLITSTYSHHLM
jgi:hypothetical protein